VTDLDLVAYLSSRLCHDLVGPIGALGNGVEILAEEEDPEMREQAGQLLAASVSEATRRLQYFRMAFGALGGLSDRVGTDNVRRTAEAFFEQGRIKLVWPTDAGLTPDLSKNAAKLVLNLLLVAQTTLPRGGELRLQADSSGLAVAATGVGARIEPDIEKSLTGDPEAELDSHTAIPRYAALLAGALGGKVLVAAPATGQVELRYRGGLG